MIEISDAAVEAALEARVKELEAALREFLFGDPAMEKILFGHLPDDETGTFTMRLGTLRRARAALAPAAPEGDAG